MNSPLPPVSLFIVASNKAINVACNIFACNLYNTRDNFISLIKTLAKVHQCERVESIGCASLRDAKREKKNALNAGNLASLQLTESVSGPIMETYAHHSQLHSHSQCQSQFQPRVPVQLAVGLQVQSSLGLSLMPCWMTFYLIAVNFVPSALFKCKFYFFQLPTPAPPGFSPSLFCGIAQIQLKPQNFWLFVPLHRCWRKASVVRGKRGLHIIKN